MAGSDARIFNDLAMVSNTSRGCSRMRVYRSITATPPRRELRSIPAQQIFFETVPHDASARDRIEGGKRLVRQYDLRLHRQYLREREAIARFQLPTIVVSCSPEMLASALMRPPAMRLCRTRSADSRSMVTVSGYRESR